MNKQIKNAIYELLKNKNHYPKNEFYKKITWDLKCEASDVERVFNLMKDNGEVDFARDDFMLVRLTNEGIKANSFWYIKCLKYLGNNWIAILALVISLITWLWK